MKYVIPIILLSLLVISCEKDSVSEEETADTTGIVSQTCELPSAASIDKSRGDCSETLGIESTVSITTSGQNRLITSNNIPQHKVGLFGSALGAINPNAISKQNSSYTIPKNGTKATAKTYLLGNSGPDYSFGILLNGVELDPVAAEAWPHTGMMSANLNWEWNLEALNVKIGLDCNSAHVQPTGKYHYHGKPSLYLETLNISTQSPKMLLVGYAADGFPIYYKYAYKVASENTSEIVAMTSGYKLKEGSRPGDGTTAPCGTYDGVYSNDYEYVENLGTLDECNGRFGVTPESETEIYYYVITDEFPSIPRCFVGTPSQSFKLGGGSAPK